MACLFWYIYTCICMHAYMSVCIHICMYVCMYVCVHVCVHVCMWMGVFVCVHICVFVCMHYSCIHACRNTRNKTISFLIRMCEAQVQYNHSKSDSVLLTSDCSTALPWDTSKAPFHQSSSSNGDQRVKDTVYMLEILHVFVDQCSQSLVTQTLLSTIISFHVRPELSACARHVDFTSDQ